MKLFLGFLIWFPMGFVVGVLTALFLSVLKYTFKPGDIPK